jgi:hypothetical protein
MPNKKLRPPTKTEEDQLFENLLGADEELDIESARQIIEAHGIKPSALVSKFKAKVEDEARKLRLQGQAVPPLIQNALQNLKTGPAERHDPIAADPTAWLNALLGGSLTPIQQQPAYSFRPHKPGEQLSSNDKDILDSLSAEIEDEETTK